MAAAPARAAALAPLCSTSRRGFAVTPSRSDLKAASGLEDAARTARRAAEQQGGSSRVGPFPYVEPSTAGNPRLPWRELGGGEKVGRSIVNSSNL